MHQRPRTEKTNFERTGRPVGRSTKDSNHLPLLTLLLVMAILASPGRAHSKSKLGAGNSGTGNSGVEEQLRFKDGDENGNEVKALKTELLVIKSEKRALDQLLKLQKKYSGTRMEPEILFRLAELYMRRARSERFFEVHKNSDQIFTVVPQLVKDASEAAEVRKAITIYEQLQTKFVSFRSMDVVLFNTAYARQQLGDDKEAEKLFFKVVKMHPLSQLVADSYLAIGEINFARRNFSFALENFHAVRKYPSARAYPYGLYKAAWCYYNLQDTDSGLKQLEEVVKFGRELALTKQESKLDLRKEALGDMALFFSDSKPSVQAVDYFLDQAKELDAAPFVFRLVELYKRHSKLADVESVLKEVIAKMSKSEAIPQAHEELVWNFERMKNRAGAVAQLEAFDSWCVSENAPGAKSCQDKIAETSKKLASRWHAQWKKQGGPDDLALSAEKGYRLYLKTARPDAMPNARSEVANELPSVRFSYAELLFARGQFKEASEHYAAVDGYCKEIRGKPRCSNIDSKIGHDAAYGALVALEKENERASQGKWSDTDEKRFIVLSNVYVARFPQGQYAFDLQFKRAFIAYEKERYDEAAPLFKKIGWAELPSAAQVPEKVVKAQDLYLDILNVKKDYTALKEAAQSLIARSSNGEARGAQIEKIYREAFFSEIQGMEEKGNLQGAVEAYKKFALENQASELASKAWWNASQLQFRLGDAQGGANTCYQMHKLFPGSSNGKDCLTKAAQTFEAMARLDLAARVLLNLALVEVEKQDHWREVAADFFALSDSKSRSVTMYLKLAEDRKDQSQQVALYEKAALLAKDLGDAKTEDFIEAKFSQMGVEPQSSRLVVIQAEEAFVKSDFTKAFNLAKRVIAKDSLPKDLLARARFVQAQVLEDEYKRQSVKTKADRLGLVLAIKTEKLEKAQKAYQSSIRYNDALTSVKALRRLAELYFDYAKSVKNLSVVGMSEADQNALKAEVDNLAIPMEEKGIESMSQALETAKKAELHDGQIAELQAEVNRLNMKPVSSVAISVTTPATYLPVFSDSRSSRSEVGL